MKTPWLFILRALLAVAFFAGAVHGALAAGDREIRIELLPNVSTTDGVVRLGEIANIRTNDLGAIRQLVSLPLGKSPRIGASALVRRETLARWIGSRLNIDLQNVTWGGVDETRVESVPQQVSGTRIGQAAETALKDWLTRHADRFHVEEALETRDVLVSTGKVSIAARPLAAAQRLAPRMVVWVDVRVNNAFVRSVPVAFRVEASRSASVSRGEWVTARSGAGQVSVEQRVQALQDGDIGQIVRIRSAASSTVQARVVAVGEVEVLR